MVQARVTHTARVAEHSEDERVDLLVPQRSRLLCAVQTLDEQAHQLHERVRCPLLESFRLLHVYLLVHERVEVCRGDVHLLELEVERSGEDQHETEADVLERRCKGLMVVHSSTLREALGHDSRLAPLDGAGGGVLGLQHPLAPDGSAASRQRDQTPGAVGAVRFDLRLHGRDPLGALGSRSRHGLAIRARVRRGRLTRLECMLLFLLCCFLQVQFECVGVHLPRE